MKSLKPIIALLFTLLTIIGAQVNISLPVSPVPFILSDFFIILGALYLGSRWAMVSTGLYLILGAIGLPVFAGGAGGWQHFTGPTGGYLAGFMVAAFVIGVISEQKPQSILWDLTAWLTGAIVIFAFGLTGLILIANSGFQAAVESGFLPFIPAATTKGLVAVGVVQLFRRLEEKTNEKCNP